MSRCIDEKHVWTPGRVRCICRRLSRLSTNGPRYRIVQVYAIATPTPRRWASRT